jgi:hypothetical protein
MNRSNPRMASELEPNLSVLPAEQRQLWHELGSLPSSFVLCGGTAIALQLGHRSSLDFDFTSNQPFDPDQLYSSLPFLKDSRPIQKAPNTLTCSIDRTVSVQISFFGTPNLHFTTTPLVARDNHVRVAALIDLAAMKAVVVQKRAEAKDYVDLDAILQSGQIDLPMALAAAKKIYGSSFNPLLSLKALCFFGDGNLGSLPRETQNRLAATVRSVDLATLPEIKPL